VQGGQKVRVGTESAKKAEGAGGAGGGKRVLTRGVCSLLGVLWSVLGVGSCDDSRCDNVMTAVQSLLQVAENRMCSLTVVMTAVVMTAVQSLLQDGEKPASAASSSPAPTSSPVPCVSVYLASVYLPSWFLCLRMRTHA